MDMNSLTDFNNISGGIEDGMSYKSEYNPSICLGAGGPTWSGAPFVDVVKVNNGTAKVDELKLRFRT